MFCTHCGNEVKQESAKCPYCEKPLSMASSKTSARSCLIVLFAIIVIGGFITAFLFNFPRLRNIFSPKRNGPIQTPANEPQTSKDPESFSREKGSDEADLRALYGSYLETLENPDPQKLQKFVQKGAITRTQRRR